ncbi:MAG: NRDE family protein [Thermoanaerobaculia bacterium]
MCLIVLALNAHPLYPLVVVANRDEALGRPTAPAAFWPEEAGLLAGRDLESGGTWMGVTRTGRFAALTNVRDPGAHDPGAPSRGGLVVRFLAGEDEPLAHVRAVAAERVRRNGFNLLAGAGGRLAWVSNAGGRPADVNPGVHAVSNASLDSPWPKALRAAAGLRRALAAGSTVDPEELFAILSDRRLAGDAELPATGVPLEVERLLSAPFIVAPGYGTRASTLLLATRDGRAELLERRFDATFRESGTSRFEVAFPGWNGAVETRFPPS